MRDSRVLKVPLTGEPSASSFSQVSQIRRTERIFTLSSQYLLMPLSSQSKHWGAAGMQGVSRLPRPARIRGGVWLNAPIVNEPPNVNGLIFIDSPVWPLIFEQQQQQQKKLILSNWCQIYTRLKSPECRQHTGVSKGKNSKLQFVLVQIKALLTEKETAIKYLIL